MKFQKVLHDLDSLSEELGIITKQNYEFILANLNWEKGQTMKLHSLAANFQTFIPSVCKNVRI